MHRAGYVHGDVKPTNILIHDGRAKLADFGTSTKWRARLRGGTPGYLPESALQYGVEVSDDVYSLAFTAWECLFGEPPFGQAPAGTSDGAFVYYNERAYERAFIEPTLEPGMPYSLVWLLKAGLAHERSERPVLSEFIRQLEEIVATPDTLKRGVFARNHSLASMLTCSLLFAGVGFACARHGRDGEARLVEVAMRSQPPLLRAEMAARMGDGATAIAIINNLVRIDQPLSEETIAGIERVASTLASVGLHDDAKVAGSFAKYEITVQHRKNR